MSDVRKGIEKIHQELKQLSQRQLELSKAHQQQFFLYRWLQEPDAELQSVNNTIARLDKRELEYMKVIQNAASAPTPVEEKDWSKSPFYSHTLKSWNFHYP